MALLDLGSRPEPVRAFAALALVAMLGCGGDVEEAQPVTVENLPAVQPVSSAAFPYQENASDARHNTNLVFAEFSPVPAGSRLAIQDVAGHTVVGGSGTLPSVVRCELYVRQGTTTIVKRAIPASGPKPNISGAPSLVEVINTSVVAYAEAGQRPALSCLFNASPEHLRIEAYLAGHLLPLD